MKMLLNRGTLTAQPEKIAEFLLLVKQDADFLRASYPAFDAWLHQKVVPGLFSGERTVLLEHRDGSPVAMMILKHSQLEKKLCTLRVRPSHESRGLGIKLFETAFELLETSRPLLSVSECKLPKFTRIFDHFGFAREAVYEGLYLPQVQEFSFNGLLDMSGAETSSHSSHGSKRQFSERERHSNLALACS